MLENPFKPNTPIEKTSPKANEKLVGGMLGADVASEYVALELERGGKKDALDTQLIPLEHQALNHFKEHEVWDEEDYIEWAASIGGDAYWVNQSFIFHENGDVESVRGLYLADHKNLISLPPNLIRIKERGLRIENCPSFKSLGNLKEVEGGFVIDSCSSFEFMQQYFYCAGSVYVENCDSLAKLPDGLIVKGELTLENCSSLEAIGEQTYVGESLTIRDCPSLINLPMSLQIGGPILCPQVLQKDARSLKSKGKIQGHVLKTSIENK